MIRYLIFILFSGVFLFPACTQIETSVFHNTPNGLKYQFHLSNTQNQAVQLFDVVEVYLSYRTSESVLYSSYPQTVAFQVAPVLDGDIMEGLMLMHSGDSATFVMNTADFYRKMMQFDEVPDHSKDYNELLFDIKVVKIIPETPAIRSRRIVFHEQKSSEADRIAKYLESENYALEPDEKGLYYIPLMEGTGKYPEKNNLVRLNYRATFLDGQLYNSTFENEDQFSFTIGSGEVIEGLEAGVLLTKLGGKAKLIIPSRLAYHGLQRNDIKPFTPLVFEIEILNIRESKF